MSLALVIPAVAGPFDLGTIVQRSGLVIDRRTGAVHLDAGNSPSIPRALGGIALHLGDLRLHLDRRRFTLNPTRCAQMSVGATMERLAGELTGQPLGLSEPFATTQCGRLGVDPKLALRLSDNGGREGQHKVLISTVRARRGDANLRKAEVLIPRMGLADENEPRTLCSLKSFKKDACPKSAIRGRAVVNTPILERPLQGSVYLRASRRSWRSLAISFRGPADIDLIGRIESVRGGSRIVFPSLPDIPVEKLVLRIDRGENGLVADKNGACGSRGTAQFVGQNGRHSVSESLLSCGM
jgi:hypothetical protein